MSVCKAWIGSGSNNLQVKVPRENIDGKALASSPCSEERRGIRRIKVVITKKQLQQLLDKQISLQEVVEERQKKNHVNCCNMNKIEDMISSWSPKLETIYEL